MPRRLRLDWRQEWEAELNTRDELAKWKTIPFSFRKIINGIHTASAEARTQDLPLYTFRNRTTGEIRQLTDAGRGNITGLWSDLGRFKTPTLRALAARAPYFHNGIALTLEDVVRHYETHLGFVFTDQQRADLVAFLNAL